MRSPRRLKYAQRIRLLLPMLTALAAPVGALSRDLIPTGDDFEITGEIRFVPTDPVLLTTPDDGFVATVASTAS